jgi:hypothetical protein
MWCKFGSVQILKSMQLSATALSPSIGIRSWSDGTMHQRSMQALTVHEILSSFVELGANGLLH